MHPLFCPTLQAFAPHGAKMLLTAGSPEWGTRGHAVTTTPTHDPGAGRLTDTLIDISGIIFYSVFI